MTLINKKGGGDFMNWEDMTSQFRGELDTAMEQKVRYGDTQGITDIVQRIQEESFFEGMHYAVEVLQEIIEKRSDRS